MELVMPKTKLKSVKGYALVMDGETLIDFGTNRTMVRNAGAFVKAYSNHYFKVIPVLITPIVKKGKK